MNGRPPRKSPNRQVIGRRNKFNGATFENIITNACRDYASRRVALIDKTPEPMRPLRPLGRGQFVACFEKKAQPDFKGVLMGGRTIVFEAKHTETGRAHQDIVSEAQAAYMDIMQDAGALCFVLMSFSFETFARIPWSVWTNMKAHFGRKFITQKEAACYAVPFDGMRLDFLKGIEPAKD